MHEKKITLFVASNFAETAVNSLFQATVKTVDHLVSEWALNTAKNSVFGSSRYQPL